MKVIQNNTRFYVEDKKYTHLYCFFLNYLQADNDDLLFDDSQDGDVSTADKDLNDNAVSPVSSPLLQSFIEGQHHRKSSVKKKHGTTHKVNISASSASTSAHEARHVRHGRPKQKSNDKKHPQLKDKSASQVKDDLWLNDAIFQDNVFDDEDYGDDGSGSTPGLIPDGEGSGPPTPVVEPPTSPVPTDIPGKTSTCIISLNLSRKFNDAHPFHCVNT